MLLPANETNSGDELTVVTVASEMVPLAKTGGLGDVCGALPLALESQNCRNYIFLPAYQSSLSAGIAIEPTDHTFTIEINGKHIACKLLRAKLPDTDAQVFLIDQPQYFDRAGLYGNEHGEFPDNCERFCFFCRAVVHAIDHLGLEPDVLHCHDWQAGLLPALVNARYGNGHWQDTVKVVMTIHNLAYQGRFWHHDMPLTGLDWSYFTPEGIEYYGDINLLKAGIVYADIVTTVSPTYAKEITTRAFGCGLETVLLNRGGQLVGIVNGVDYQQWDPSTDIHLPQNYDHTNWREGKTACKVALQEQLELPIDAGKPLIGIVSRIADQKGWDLIIPLLSHWLDCREVQWAILGTGDQAIERRLQELRTRFPTKLGLSLSFSESLAHRIEAAADIFLMPSRYEPCGLNQLYSLRYGSVPVVHATGGLADTVRDASHSEEPNGFSFQDYSQIALERCLSRAVECMLNSESQWTGLVETGMKDNWSWDQSATRYKGIFDELVAQKHKR